jgi:hypothetical protein
MAVSLLSSTQDGVRTQNEKEELIENSCFHHINQTNYSKMDSGVCYLDPVDRLATLEIHVKTAGKNVTQSD